MNEVQDMLASAFVKTSIYILLFVFFMAVHKWTSVHTYKRTIQKKAHEDRNKMWNFDLPKMNESKFGLLCFVLGVSFASYYSVQTK